MAGDCPVRDMSVTGEAPFRSRSLHAGLLQSERFVQWSAKLRSGRFSLDFLCSDSRAEDNGRNLQPRTSSDDGRSEKTGPEGALVPSNAIQSRRPATPRDLDWTVTLRGSSQVRCRSNARSRSSQWLFLLAGMTVRMQRQYADQNHCLGPSQDYGLALTDLFLGPQRIHVAESALQGRSSFTDDESRTLAGDSQGLG